MNVIEVRNFKKYYGKFRGVENMDMTVRNGDFYGFVGPNGAGKSTTIRTLLGFIRPTGGSGQVFGLACEKHTPEILKRTGYMPSEAFFYGEMRVGEVIRLAARLHRMDCEGEAKRLCARFEVDTKKRIEDLSLGNRKKVSIICAMQHRPELLVLDEPTSGLDPLMQKEFFDVLKEYHQAGTTILLSSHNLTEIQSHCNRLGVVKDGRMIAEDDIGEFSHNSAKRVRLTLSEGSGIHKTFVKTSGEVPGDFDINVLEGVADFKREGPSLSFFYRGDIPALMECLARVKLQDVLIEEPGLEEIILHYYEKNERGKG